MTRDGQRYVPVRSVFEATLACNLRCIHCGSRAGRCRSNELSAREAAEVFAQLADLGCRRVTISGGEPLIRQDWPQLIAAAHHTGMGVALITNGILFDGDAAKLAREEGLDAVAFSVDGIGRTHDRVRGRIGHYRMVEQAIGAAIGAGLRFAIVTHLNRLNIGELPQIHDLARDRGAYAWQVQPGTDMGNFSDHPELLLRPLDLLRAEQVVGTLAKRGEVPIAECNAFGYFGQHEKLLRHGHAYRGCPAGTRTLGIESNGNVKGCLAIMPGENERGASFVEGNVREEPLADIWNRPGAFAYNRDWSLDDLTGFCRECRYARRCRGGCRSNMVASGGGTENPICVYRAAAEGRRRSRRAGQAAAALAASLLAASFHACGAERTDAGDGEVQDAGVDAGEDAGGDADADADVDGDTDVYDAPPY